MQQPDANYLGRDFASLSEMLLDHLAREAPDLGTPPLASVEMALIEAMAYVGDYLSYFQDAVATEAYPQTARQRMSLARHGELSGRRIVEGCCARTLLHFETSEDGVRVAAHTDALTGVSGVDGTHLPEGAVAGAAVCFTTLHDLVLRREHNAMALAEGSQPRAGDCSALLAGRREALAPGSILLIEHVEREWRHPVLVTRVEPGEMATRIDWHAGDALRNDAPTAGAWRVRGNLALAEEGETARIVEPLRFDAERGEVRLYAPPPAYAAPFTPWPRGGRAISTELRPDPETAEPVILLREGWRGLDESNWPFRQWRGRRDLTGAAPQARLFRPESLGDGRLRLSFAGGLRPASGMPLYASYRVTRGLGGNISAGAVLHLRGADRRIVSVTNPLPATGGCGPEPIERARERVLAGPRHGAALRCVAAADYEKLVAAHPAVDACTVSLRRQNGLRRVEIGVLMREGRSLDPRLVAMLEEYVGPARLLGDEVVVAPAPTVVPHVDMELRAASHVAAATLANVREALLARPARFESEAFGRELVSETLALPGVELCRLVTLTFDPPAGVEDGVRPVRLAMLRDERLTIRLVEA